MRTHNEKNQLGFIRVEELHSSTTMSTISTISKTSAITTTATSTTVSSATLGGTVWYCSHLKPELAPYCEMF